METTKLLPPTDVVVLLSLPPSVSMLNVSFYLSFTLFLFLLLPCTLSPVFRSCRAHAENGRRYGASMFSIGFVEKSASRNAFIIILFHVTFSKQHAHITITQPPPTFPLTILLDCSCLKKIRAYSYFLVYLE